MKETLQHLLLKVAADCVQENIKFNLFLDSLIIEQSNLGTEILTTAEQELCRAGETSQKCFLTLFDLLKPKPENEFLPLQKVFYSGGWTGTYELIRSELKNLGKDRLLLFQMSHTQRSYTDSIVEELKERYRKDSEIMRRYWKQFDLDDIMDMDTFYSYEIEIKPKGRKLKNEIKSFEDLFQIEDKRFVIEADAGYGKSTFVHQMAREWVQQKDWAKKFEYLFLFRLGELESHHTTSLQNLFQKCLSDYNAYIVVDKHFGRDIFLKSTLFIFDGLDEKADDFSKEVDEILYGTGLNLYTVVITSRSGEKLNKIKKNSSIDTTILLKGFTMEGVEKQVKKFSGPPVPDLSNKNTFELFRVPLNLTIYCITYGSSSVKCNNLCSLVETFVDFLCSKYRRIVGRNKFTVETEKQLLKALGEAAQNQYKFVEGVTLEFQHLTLELLTVAIDIGLIHKRSRFENIIFIHRTIAEHCGAYFWQKDIETMEIINDWVNVVLPNQIKPNQHGCGFGITSNFVRMLSYISKPLKRMLWKEFIANVPSFDEYDSLPMKTLTVVEGYTSLKLSDNHSVSEKEIVLEKLQLPPGIGVLEISNGYFDNHLLFENIDQVWKVVLDNCKIVCDLQAFFNAIKGKSFTCTDCSFGINPGLDFEIRLSSLEIIRCCFANNVTSFFTFVIQKCHYLKRLKITSFNSRTLTIFDSENSDWLMDLQKNISVSHILEYFSFNCPYLPDCSSFLQVVTEMKNLKQLHLNFQRQLKKDELKQLFTYFMDAKLKGIKSMTIDITINDLSHDLQIVLTTDACCLTLPSINFKSDFETFVNEMTETFKFEELLFRDIHFEKHSLHRISKILNYAESCLRIHFLDCLFSISPFTLRNAERFQFKSCKFYQRTFCNNTLHFMKKTFIENCELYFDEVAVHGDDSRINDLLFITKTCKMIKRFLLDLDWNFGIKKMLLK